MLFRRLLFVLLFFITLSPSLSRPTSSVPTSRQWRSREFEIFLNHQGIPQLEGDENQARDPENISDSEIPSPIPTRRARPSDADFPTASPEVLNNDASNPPAPFEAVQEHDPTIEPSPYFTTNGGKMNKEPSRAEPSDSADNQRPETAIIVDPISETEGPQPNSQQILSDDNGRDEGAEQNEPAQSPQMLDFLSPSPSRTQPPTRPGAPRFSVQPSSDPLASLAPMRPSRMPTMSLSASSSPTFVAMLTPTGTQSQVAVDGFGSPLPSPSVVMPSSGDPITTAEVTTIPTTSLSATPSPTMASLESSLGPSIVETPSSLRSPEITVSDIPSSSVTPSSAMTEVSSPSAGPSSRVSMAPSPSASPNSDTSKSPSPTPRNVTATAVPPTLASPEASPILPSPPVSVRPSPSASPESMASSITPASTDSIIEKAMSASPVPSVTVVLPTPPAISPKITPVLPVPPPVVASPSAEASPASASPSVLASPSAEASPSANAPSVSPSNGAFPSAEASPPAETSLPVVVSPSAKVSASAEVSPTAVSTTVDPSPSISPSSLKPPSDGAGTTGTPESGESFECLYFGSGQLSEFSSPDPSLFAGNTSQFTVPQQQFPDLAPEYLSHTFGELWSYELPVEVGGTYELVLAFAEVYDEACNAGPDGGFRKFTVSVQDQKDTLDIMEEVGCGTPLQKPYTGIISKSDSILVSFNSINQNAFLNTLCYRPSVGATTPQPNPSPSPVLSPSPFPFPLPSTASGDNIVGPDSDHQCINFGPNVIDGYTLFDENSVQGNVSIYSGSNVIPNPSLPLPYRYHIFGEQWTYELKVPSSSPQSLILGFAEVFSEACEAGTDAGFRVFSASVGDQVRVLDIMSNVGCAVVEQIVFDDVSPVDGTIAISFSAVTEKAMLSVICYKDADSASPVGTDTPEPTAVPVAVSSSPKPSKEAVDTAVPQPTLTPTATALFPTTSPVPSSAPESSSQETRTCFKFEGEIVEGYFNVQVPSPESGIGFFSQPSADIEGTSLDSVYSSHVFGSEFTFSVNTGNIAIKSVELGFAEVYEPTCAENARVFTVEVGSTARNVDVFKEAGCLTALDIRLDGIVPSSSGVVDIVFTTVENFAMVSAICIIENEAGSNTAFGKGPGGDSGDEEGNLIAVVSPGRPGKSPLPSPSPPAESKPLLSPSPSLFPKENGIIITGPSQTPQTTPETIIAGPGLTNEEHGEGLSPSWTPLPSDMLYPSNLTSTTLGVEQSPTPLASFTASQTPVGNPVSADASSKPSVEYFVPSRTPSPTHNSGPAKTPSVSYSPVAIIPGDNEDEPTASPEENDDDMAPDSTDPLGPGKQGVEPAPTTTSKPNESPEMLVTAVPPSGTDSSNSASPTPSVSGVQPSEPPSPTLTPTPTDNGSDSALPIVLSVSPRPSGSLGAILQSPSSGDVGEEEPENSVDPLSELPETTPEVAVTAVPPAQSPTDAGANVTNSDSPEGVILGTGQEISGVNASPSFIPSSSNATISGPSPINSRQPLEVLPPVEPPLPSPSALPLPQGSPSPLTAPTLTPAPSIPLATPNPSISFPSLSAPSPSISASLPSASVPTPASSESPATAISIVVTPFSTSPSPTLDTPSIVPPSQITPSGSAATTNASPSVAATVSAESPSPVPSRVSSTTGSDEVISISSVTPTAVPQESSSPPDPAPAKPVSSVSDNSTAAIGVPEGTDIDEDGGNVDATGGSDDEEGPTIVAGPFMDLIGTKPEGNGFKIGMGVLGSLLVLLLLICLFFAIFRGRGGSYSYSSDYSAHKPTDYDPSQGGYTDELGLGTGPGNGNEASYDGALPDGLSGGGPTFDSRPQTQNGSFTYEGAGAGLGGTVGSTYGLDPQMDDAGPQDTSAYTNPEPDHFAEYSSPHMPGASGLEQSQAGNSENFTFNETYTVQTENVYSSVAHDGEQDRVEDEVETMAALGSRPFRASNSFNAYHSIARPMAHESESSGKQERTMESFAYGDGPWGAHRDGERNAGSGYSDAQDSRAQSMSSAPSATPSPYEQNIHIDIVHDSSGNVHERFPESSRFLSTGMRRAGLGGTAGNSGATKCAGGVGTEPYVGDFVCNEYAETNTGAGFVGQTTDNTIPQRGSTTNDASVEGPWPTWWSGSKRNLVPTGAFMDGESQTPEARSASDAGYSGDQSKENDESSYEVKRSIFENNSDGVCVGTRSPQQRNADPLGPSSKANLVVDESQQFVSDSGWLRFSRTSRKSDQVEVEDEDSPNYDELRRRRQPYVKSVANRLSVGAQSHSTSITRESAIYQARKPFEREQADLKTGAERNSSSWITQGPIEI